MMKIKILTCLTITYFSLQTFTINAQGLFSNGDFENHTSCPMNFGQIENLIGFTSIAETPDYFNTCNFVQNSCRTITPFSGNGCIGMFGGPWNSTSTQQELASINLDAPTILGTTYELNFYLLGENQAFAPCYKPGAGSCFDFGFYFYKSSDNFSWPSSSFFAQGTFPEPHLIISGADIISDSWNAYSLQFLADSDYDRVLFGWFPNNNSYSNACLTPSANSFTGYVYMDKLCIDVLGSNCPICSYDVTINSTVNSVCPAETINLNSTSSGGVNTVEWTSNGNGVFSSPNQNSTTYTLSNDDLALGSLNFTIKTDDPAGDCNLVMDNIAINIKSLDPIDFDYPQNSVCLPSENISPIIQIATPGVFSISNNGVINPTTGEINLTESGVGQYIVTFTSTEDCINQKELPFTICEELNPIVITPADENLVIPNIFSPNNDQINDFVSIENPSLKNIEVVILNRWGNVVFQTNELHKKWDGKDLEDKDLNEGVYFYHIKADFLSGNQMDLSGFITLVR